MSHRESYRLSILKSCGSLATLKKICEDDVDTLHKYLGMKHAWAGLMSYFKNDVKWKIFGSLLPVLHPVKFGKGTLRTYIFSPLVIWEHLESKDILDKKMHQGKRQDRRDPYHEELLGKISMKYYIFEFLPE